MRARFTQSFKIQAVEKSLERANYVTLRNIADDLGVGYSILSKWIALARQQKLEPMQDNETPRMTVDKRPQDWSGVTHQSKRHWADFFQATLICG